MATMVSSPLQMPAMAGRPFSHWIAIVLLTAAVFVASLFGLPRAVHGSDSVALDPSRQAQTRA